MRFTPKMIVVVAAVACTPDDEGESGRLRQEVLVEVAAVATPLAGATVAVEDADGVPVDEVLTGVDGVAEVAVDWSRGPFAVTVDPHLDAAALWSRVAVTEDADPLPAHFVEPRNAGRVQVFGRVPEPLPRYTLMAVSHGAGGAFFQRAGGDGSFALDVVRDEPFEILTVQFQWSDLGGGQYAQELADWRLTSGQVSEDTTLDLTDSVLASPQHTSLELVLPDDATPTLRAGLPYGWIGDAIDGFPACGWPERYGPSTSADAFAIDLAYVVPSTAGEMFRFGMVTADDGASMIWDWGAPSTWPSSRQLLPIPAFADLSFDRGSGEWSVTFDGPSDQEGAFAAAVLMAADGRSLWSVVGPTDLATWDAPSPPSTADVPALLAEATTALPYLVVPVQPARSSSSSYGAPMTLP